MSGSSVLVVGAGGLGCAVLPYLVAAGVGRIFIVDHDRVEEANLHRQPLYRTSDCGRLKAEVARLALTQINPGVRVEAVCERLTPANVAALVGRAEIVVDAADSFAVTYTLSDTCHALSKPLVSASVIGLSGYVGAFCAGAPSYRAVFPDMPSQVGSCAESGVLGTAVGVIGTLQAHVTLSLVLNLQPSALGRMFSVDLRSVRFGTFSFVGAPEPASVIPFVAPADVTAGDFVIDLRSHTEAPVSPFLGALRASVDQVADVADPALDRRVVLCCRSGVRAWRAASALQALGYRNLALVALGDA
jgi:molybdopterin/thiamine biosynthesis adenylyltransferase/rhodanese-related sulfurtransferase